MTVNSVTTINADTTVDGTLTVIDGFSAAASANGNTIANPVLTGTTTTAGINATGTVIVTGDADISNSIATKLLVFDTVSTATIASGVIAVTSSRMTIDTEGSASTDDLVSITGGTSGKVLFLQITNGARVIVVKHGTGANQIYTRLGSDFTLSNVGQVLMLVFNGTSWTEVAGSTYSAASMVTRNFDDTSTTSPATLVFPTGSTSTSSTDLLIKLAPEPIERTVIGWVAASYNTTTLNPTGGAPAMTVTGGSVIFLNSNAAGPLLEIQQASATIGAEESVRTTHASGVVNLSQKPHLKMRLVPGNMTNFRVLYGFCPIAGFTDSASNNGVYFRFDPNNGDTTWVAVSKSTFTTTATPTGVTVNSGNPFVTLEIYASASSTFKYYIDGVLVATHTTGSPGTISNLNVEMAVFSQTATSTLIPINKIILISN